MLTGANPGSAVMGPLVRTTRHERQGTLYLDWTLRARARWAWSPELGLGPGTRWAPSRVLCPACLAGLPGHLCEKPAMIMSLSSHQDARVGKEGRPDMVGFPLVAQTAKSLPAAWETTLDAWA